MMVHQGWMLAGLIWSCISIVLGSHNSRGRAENEDFRVIWNVPSQPCKKYGVDINVKQYGIKENDVNGWTGSVITIFYADQMGLYPEVLPSGRILNGGIPQRVNLADHVRKCESDIQSRISDPDFSGLGVIDYEGWRPIWERNWDSKSVYRNLSESLVREQHPSWSSEQVTEEAIRQFEAAARSYLLATLQTAKRLRPRGQWGFYLFPKCYNYHGVRKCSRATRTANERLLWMLNNSTALFPSAYLSNSLNPRENSNFVYGELHETSRLRKKVTDRHKPVYLYSRVRYGTDHTWYTEVDLNNTIRQAHDLLMSGVVLWDDNHLWDNSTICTATKNYVDNVLGPFVRQLVHTNDTSRSRGIIWSNRHTLAKPFNKRRRCRNPPCNRHRLHRSDQLEIVVFDLA